MTAACRSCSAPVFFVRSKPCRNMCLNASPDSERGNVLISADAGRKEVARVLAKDNARVMRAMGTRLYLSHHADCPDAARWTRPMAQRAQT